MQANFLLLIICVALYFFLSPSTSGWNAARVYFELFMLFLTAVALLFLELWPVDPARKSRAASALLVPLILAFDSACGVFFDDSDGGLDYYSHAYLLFLVSVMAVFVRVRVADVGCVGAAAPSATTALLVFLFLKLGTAVVFSYYRIQGTDVGGDVDLPQFILLAAGAMLTFAYR